MYQATDALSIIFYEMRFTRCYNAFYVEHPWTVKQLTFDLICDVINDPEVNEISFPLTIFTGLSNAV